jgi:formamidopyrimidine-DNA glycosylase
MPELPEVETLVRGLREGTASTPPLPGMIITKATLSWPRHVAEPSPTAFRQRIRERNILDVKRRGKHFLFPLDQGTLLIHLGMSGDLRLATADAPPDRFQHTVFHLEGGWQLRFNDARKFGRLRLLDDPTSFLSALGPEPLDAGFKAEDLRARIQGRRRALKPLLLDQSFLAGVGNIYADEALHRARLHPLRPANTLTPAEVRQLHRSIRAALRQGVRHNGASIDWVFRGGGFQNHFRVYGRADHPCPVCKTPVQRIVVAQRGTHLCPSCQPEIVS